MFYTLSMGLECCSKFPDQTHDMLRDAGSCVQALTAGGTGLLLSGALA